MKILIIGGYGLNGVSIAERLDKEGVQIYVLDNLTSNKVTNYKFKHKIYKVDVCDKKIEYVFDSNRFECVIYLAQATGNKLYGLKNALYLAKKSGVKKFISLYVPSENEDISLKADHEAAFSYLKSFNCENMIVKILKINGTYGIFQNVRDGYIYVKDVSDAIYRLINDTSLSKDNIMVECEDLKKIGWKKKYSLEDGLKENDLWNKENRNIIKALKVKKKKSKPKFKFIIPYFENILSFIILYLINLYLVKNGINITFELSLIYIVVFSIVYGTKHSVISAAFSSVLCIISELNNGEIPIMLIYNADMFIVIISYLFTGFTLGYITDSKTQRIMELENEIKSQKNEFEFLISIFEENKKEKRKLANQIINNEDSFTKIYEVTEKLNLLSPDIILDKSIEVICNIMKVKEACIYIVQEGQKYLRLISQSDVYFSSINKSINLDEHEDIRKCIEDKAIFINKNMGRNIPVMMSPILIKGEVIALISIGDIDFNELDLYKVNLFKVVSYLITSALSKAYLYEKAIEDEKYVKDTEILTPKYFDEIRKNKSGNFVILKADRKDYEKIIKLTRVIDCVGIDDDGSFFVFLTNTKHNEAENVVKRLLSNGVKTSINV
ncbi:NAD-dependent epimerase/dehydratase family protein [Clostridium sp. BJN0001]|uniref:NAD-dependent epimerase/dehydratase family protein n=1 Tax=Clostridium sp. BJN0001 TaxID=2930219 RepID=UPI001FD4C091|nr:NAD-dependent epimerase/dehydratase family protein [Clostridium sp. BJN0001]